MTAFRPVLRGAIHPSVLDGSATLPGLLLSRALDFPRRLALREKHRGIWRRFTWADYLCRVRRFALFLQARGFGPGDRLAIAADGCPEWFFADLAAQSLGGTTVGIYPTNPWPELQYIVRHCKARVVVCGDQEQTDKVLQALAEDGGLPDVRDVVTVDCKGMQHYEHPLLSSFEAALADGAARESGASEAAFVRQIGLLRPEQDAIIVYTSGTTGMPKGARISHRGVITAARVLGEVYGFEGRELSALCYLPLCHVAERLFSTVAQLAWNGVVNFAESIDTVSHDLREIAPTYFLGVPRIWEKIQHTVTLRSAESHRFARFVFCRALELSTGIARRAYENPGGIASRRDRLLGWLLQKLVFDNLLASLGLDRMFLAVAGGAPVSDSVTLFFRAIGLPVHQVYGMTETSGLVNLQRPGALRLGWAGSPVPGIEERIADDGELQVRGAMVFNGYLYDVEATEAAIRDGWLCTGDVAERDPATGDIRIVDRKKAIIITSGGKNITPSLIENALKESPFVEEAILLGDGRHFLAALIQIDLDTVGKWAQARGLAYTSYQSLASLDEVRELVDAHVQEVNRRFARVENVRKFVILRKQLDHDDGEVTATMKVRRAVIERKFASEIAEIYGAETAEA